MSQNVFYITSEGHLAHHGIIGMHWGIRRYQPYPKGYSGKGKEVGKATKVKQRPTSLERAKARTAKVKVKAKIKLEKERAKTAKAKGKADLRVQKAKTAAEKQRRIDASKSGLIKGTMNKVNKSISKPSPPKAGQQSGDYEAVKRRAIESGSPKQVTKYKSGMTNDELQQAVKRINLEKQLSNYSKESITTASDRIDNMFKKAKKVSDWAETGMKTYETFNKLSKTLKKK